MKKYITMIALLFLVCVLAFAHLNRSGDVNCNGKVTITDLVILSRYLAELDDLPCPRNADMNKDGVIDQLDLTKLQRHLAGLE
ncbi:MAG: hypothetical protein FD179_1015 [Erysipelotrichaceae bacterium]|nr:MAG: hypothetical protein FD179_1015 [Erysipelotrichaceae bacterium]